MFVVQEFGGADAVAAGSRRRRDVKSARLLPTPRGVQIVHFADVHLDRPFIGMDVDDARARRAGLRGAFDRCLELARARDVDLVTIGGDLWEDEHVTPDTIRWVVDRLEGAGRPVVVVAGNHDPLSPGGPFDRAAFGSNVTVLGAGDGLERVDFGGVTVWGVSWRRGIPLTARWLDRFQVPHDDRRHVLLLHGTCGAQFGGASHCPFTGDEVRRAGFDLCLAGHLHHGGIRDGVVVYPGSPEPLNWSEDGRHTAAIIDLAHASTPNVELIDVNVQRYAARRIDVTDAASSADVERAAIALLGEFGDLQGLHLRFELEGRVTPGCEPSHPRVREAVLATGVESVELRDRTRSAFDLDELAGGNGARALFVRRMRQRVADGDEAAELALELGLRALEGETL
jgi:DNA repair exonuclease SbcCD nuclease subunit